MIPINKGAPSRIMRNILATGLATIAVAVLLAASAAAQSKSESSAKDDTGFTASVEFGGTSNSAGQVYEIDSSVGCTFTKHFGMDVGVPFYFVNGSSSTAGSTSGSGVGNPSVDMRWKFPGDRVNYATMVTGTAPVGSKSLGLNTGHATFDWTNHFDHAFNQVTPFAELGFANTTSDSRLFVRPYTTFGYNAHFKGGAEIDVWKMISVGAAGYAIAPLGNQTVFSRVVGPAAAGGAGSSTAGSHGRGFNAGHQVSGTSSIGGDNGYSLWLDASLNKYTDAEIGYTRSVYYDLNSVSFSLGFNVGKLLRGSK